MHKYLFFLILLFPLNFTFEIDADSAAQNSLPRPTATVTPIPIDESIKINLDSDTVCNKFPPGQRAQEGHECSGDMEIDVAVSVSKNPQPEFRYIVSGGKIIGNGANVIWDLTGAQPGTYEIKVETHDKFSGIKQSASKLVTAISAEPFCGLCECPSLSVEANEPRIKAGNQIVFTANVSGGSAEKITHKWTVSDGEIIEGQGTPVIKVATSSEMTGKTVKAEVEIGGICEDCMNKVESNSVLITAAETDKNNSYR